MSACPVPAPGSWTLRPLRVVTSKRARCAVLWALQEPRRRANALEYSVIPDLRDTRHMIEARLEEYMRSDISRLMKVKEMLLARDQAAR